ncbi:MAG TPA: APC family permease [Gemmatimonadota bacterium]|nr:APC family permease [Gemmatimonadota bacterium]
MSEAQVSQEPSLRRAVSRWEIVGLAVNDVIGSGVYLLPAAAAALLGPASLWAVLLAGGAVALLVLCFAEASSHFDEPGGGYVYTREAFGAFVGFEVGWMTWLARIASVASLSNGFAQALGFLWDDATVGVTRALVIAVPLALLTWINVVGVKSGARTAVFLSIAKVIPLVFLIVVGLPAIDTGALFPIPAPRTDVLGEAALLLLFAYAGFENTAAAAGEYKNPQRDVPFALLTMIAVVTTLYFLIQLVALGTLPDLAERIEGAPLAAAATLLVGAWAGVVMTVGAAVSIEGNVGNTTLMGPRYLFALAEDGFGPRALASVHPTWRTPWIAILVQSAIALVLALSGSFVQLAMLSIVARLATYMGTAAAVPVLRRKFPRTKSTVRLPAGPLIPIAALALCIVFLLSATRWNLIAGAIALVVGAVLYATRRKPVARSAVPPAA